MAEIKLSGIETWASDQDIISKLEEAGFSNVSCYSISDNLRIATAIWPKASMTGEMPEQVVYIEEAPL